MKGTVLKIDWPFRARGFLGLTAFQAEGCGIALTGDEYEVSVTDLPFCIIRHDNHYGNQPPPVAFPPFGALRHHLPPPLSGGTIKP